MLRADPSGLEWREDRPSIVEGERKTPLCFFFIAKIPRLWICDVVDCVGSPWQLFFPLTTPQCCHRRVFSVATPPRRDIDAQSGARRPHQPSDCQGIVWAWLGVSPAIGFGHSNAGEGEGLGRKGKGTTSREMAVRLSSTCPPASAFRRRAGAFFPHSHDDPLPSLACSAGELLAARRTKSSEQSLGPGLDRTRPLPWSLLRLAPGDSGLRQNLIIDASVPSFRHRTTSPPRPPTPSNKTIIFPSHEVSCFSLHFFGFLFFQATQFQHTVRHQDCR